MGKKQNTPGAKPKSGRGVRIPGPVRAEIERLLRTGASNLEIAGRHGVSEGSVRNIRKRIAAAESAPEVDQAPAELTPAHADAPDAASPEAALAQVDQMVADLRQLATTAKADGNSTAAGKAMRDAANLMNLRDRLRKAAQASAGDVVTIPRELIDGKIERIYRRMRTLASAEMCPRCGCELRMAAVGAAVGAATGATKDHS